jgi:hypothetical protein
MMLLSNGGMLPQYLSPIEGEQKISARKRGVRQGAMILLLGVVLVPALGVLYGWTDFNPFGFFAALTAVLCFIGGPLRMLFAALFEEGAPTRPFVVPSSYAPPAIPPPPAARVSALPPPAANPTTGWRQRPHTAEILQPPSVTDGTTRTLEKPKPEGD